MRRHRVHDARIRRKRPSRSAPLDFEPDSPKKKKKAPCIYLGIDGEGIGREPHRYVLLAVGEESGQRNWYVENPAGLSTEECLRFIVNLPIGEYKTFAYAFNYDLTKICQDLPNEILYRLFRPETRKRTGKMAMQGPSPVWWKGYSLNLIGSKFTVGFGGRNVVIWDIWKFYQGKFVTALEDWKVGSKADQAEIERMKALRNNFKDSDLPEIRTYCFSECQNMAILAKKLVEAHEEAGLKLTSFYGAGSTASAMLKVMGIKEVLRPTPPEMRHAVASAFFGGRFENAVVGEVARPVKNWDISSAYPYQTCFLPCLLHGEWTYTTNRADLDDARAACVEYALPRSEKGEIRDWAPFPFREADGSICFPSESGGGWVWRDEYLAGERFVARENPGAVQFRSAWIYRCACTCQPFVQIPHYYRERCRIGKEGAGIVFKLGPNSVYGKLAQSVGSAMFQSWIWAGIITSGCRAQLLDLIALHEDRSDVLMVATDGAFTCGEITAPTPRDTGTWETGKPLGGWECGEIPQGIFAARPGIYFPLNPTAKDIKKVKGRGVGKGTVLDNWREIVASFRTYGIDEPVAVKDIERFCGAKTSLSYSPATKQFTRAAGGKNAHGADLPKYGEWIKRRVSMSFNPMPKRAGVMADGIHLRLRRVSGAFTSVPYSKALRSPDAVELEAATMELQEQPDGDLSDTMEDMGS